MSDVETQQLMIEGTEFDPTNDIEYSKPKVDARGGKSISVLNKKTKKVLHLSTPLMLTWGMNTFTDEATGKVSYDMSLQFPTDEYSNEAVTKFLSAIKKFEAKIKEDAVKNSKDWMNKAKMSPEVVDALMHPLLKYPKLQDGSGEADMSRPPTLKVKVPYWDGTFNVEIYDMDQQTLFPNDNGVMPVDLVTKASHVATVLQCGGLWFANGKFGVTWRLVQCVVKPKATLKGKCMIKLSESEKKVLEKSGDKEEDGAVDVEVADSSDEEEEGDEAVEVSEATEPEPPRAPSPPPAKKKVVRKKKVAED